MSAVHINDLPTTTELNDDDYFVVETANETKKVKYADMGNATALQSQYIGDVIDENIPINTLVYYNEKFYTIARDLSGETFPYTIVPSTDLSIASEITGEEIISMDEIPGSGLNATDVDFDNTGTGMTATNVQSALTELNSKIPHYAKLTNGTLNSSNHHYIEFDITSLGISDVNKIKMISPVIRGDFTAGWCIYTLSNTLIQIRCTTEWSSVPSGVSLMIEYVS